MTPRADVPLAPLTTLGLGGHARWFAAAADEADALEAVEWARSRGVPLRVLGGGSNLLVSDDGVDGLVLHMTARGRAARVDRGVAVVTAAAGEPWDDFVQWTLERGYRGLECLSGIPGTVGATPIQNVGAYGVEVGELITHVRALDRRTGGVRDLLPSECGFRYRDSHFKSGEPDRWLVLAVGFRLAMGGRAEIRYPELASKVDEAGMDVPDPQGVRRLVLELRRSKSMVWDPRDPNHRSCGSFFVNPVVTRDEAEQVRARAARRLGVERSELRMPSWFTEDGVKLAAAWLIQTSGFEKGYREGPVGLSSKHTLAVVAHDGATAQAVVDFAESVRRKVYDIHGVSLEPEPRCWGFGGGPLPGEVTS